MILRQLHQASRAWARRVIGCSLALLAPMWMVHGMDAAFLPGTLARFGLRPRDLDAGWGILVAPLLHANLAHLTANTVGLVLLGGVVAAVGRRQWLLVTLLGWFGGGIGVWALGRPAIHVGASGLVYAYLGFLLLRGWYTRSLGSIAVSVIIYWVFGEALRGMLPFGDPSVSWEGHLFGFLAGVGAAALLGKTRSRTRVPPKPSKPEGPRPTSHPTPRISCRSSPPS